MWTCVSVVWSCLVDGLVFLVACIVDVGFFTISCCVVLCCAVLFCFEWNRDWHCIRQAYDAIMCEGLCGFGICKFCPVQ